jgi:hypothetical protein
LAIVSHRPLDASRHIASGALRYLSAFIGGLRNVEHRDWTALTKLVEWSRDSPATQFGIVMYERFAKPTTLKHPLVGDWTYHHFEHRAIGKIFERDLA